MGCRRTIEFDDRLEAVGAMLSALDPDGQYATTAKFIQNELDAERGKVALLRRQGSQQKELLRQQKAAATGSTHTPTRIVED